MYFYDIGAYVSDNKAGLKNNRSRGARIKKYDAGILEGENAYKGPWGGYEGDMVGVPQGLEQVNIIFYIFLGTKPNRRLEKEN